MNRKQILLDMRNEHKLKGMKPCFILLTQNMGRIYNDGTADFIMSFKNNILYFQRLSLFLRVLKPKQDFEIDCRAYTEFKIDKKNSHTKKLTMYRKDGKFLEINYQYNLPDTFSTEENIARILEDFKKLGMKEIFDEI